MEKRWSNHEALRSRLLVIIYDKGKRRVIVVKVVRHLCVIQELPCNGIEVTPHENGIQDSLQLSGAYTEIELLSPWSMTAFRIFWANGLAREVDWKSL